MALRVEDMTAADVRVGQVWRRMVTQADNRRQRWTITEIDGDTVRLEAGDKLGSVVKIGLGHLLAYWMPGA